MTGIEHTQPTHASLQARKPLPVILPIDHISSSDTSLASNNSSHGVLHLRREPRSQAERVDYEIFTVVENETFLPDPKTSTGIQKWSVNLES